jgi:hypothetical protein
MAHARVALWVVTLTALAVCVRALFIDVVPGIFAGAALCALLVTYLLGVFNPRWEMFGNISEPKRTLFLHTMPETAAAQALLAQIAAQYTVSLLAVVDELSLGAQLTHPSSSQPGTQSSTQVNTEQLESSRLPQTENKSEDCYALELPLALVALCFVFSRPASHWLQRGKAFAQRRDAQVSCVLLPRYFAPSGCFIAAKSSGLEVVLAPRRRYSLAKQAPNAVGNLGVAQLKEFPVSPTPEQVSAWFTQLSDVPVVAGPNDT